MVALAGAVVPAAFAAGRVSFEDTSWSGKPLGGDPDEQAASFRVVLRVPTQGRAQLFLSGKRLRAAARSSR